MTAHITKCPRTEIEPFAPVYRMIIPVANEWPLRAYAQPKIPIEATRRSSRTLRRRPRITPRLGTPRMDLFDLPNCSVTHQLRRHSVMVDRMDLNAHLGHEPFGAREFSELPHFIEVVREGFLAIHMFAQ